MNEKGLGTLVTFNPVSVRADMLLEELAARLESTGFHHWPVIDERRRLIGIVSDDDVSRNLAARRAAQQALCGSNASTSALPAVTSADIMSPRVLSVPMSATPFEALEVLLDHGIHSVPVVDEQRQLVGIVTSTDFLREFPLYAASALRAPVVRQMIKTEESLEADLGLDEARERLVASGLYYIAVTKGECPLGVVSQRMLRKAKCRQLLEVCRHGQAAAAGLRLIDLVKTAPTLKPGDRLARAAALMVEHQVQAVVVVNQGRKLLESSVETCAPVARMFSMCIIGRI